MVKVLLSVRLTLVPRKQYFRNVSEVVYFSEYFIVQETALCAFSGGDSGALRGPAGAGCARAGQTSARGTVRSASEYAEARASNTVCECPHRLEVYVEQRATHGVEMHIEQYAT